MSATAFLLDVTVKATVILAAAWVLIAAMPRAAAATRYFVWSCGLSAVLMLPVLSLVLPAWHLPVKTSLPRPVAAVGGLPETAGAEPETIAVPLPVTATRSIPWLGIIWLGGALLTLARLGIGHWRLARLLGRARTVAQIGERGDVRLKVSSETDVPLTCGVWATAVILPESAEEWDAERRRVVLLHELTHARRMDPRLWLMAQMAAAVYWFHPLVWLAVARFRREQERSCDDAVVRAGVGQPVYARHLVELARSVAPAGSYAAALGMAGASDLEHRVRALLDPTRKRRGLKRSAYAAMAAAMLAVMLPLAALHAQGSGQTVTISGTVRDPSGAVVPYVLVLLKNANNQEAARANAAGEYKLSLPAGSYTMEVRAPGFAEFHKPLVLPADTLSNVTLDLGQVNESMDVVGKAPIPQASGTPHRIRVGGMVQATKLVSMAKPVYPPGAEAAGIEGTVLLRAVISTGGDPLGVSVINTSVDPELAKAAMDAVKQWHYQPTLLNGEPVEVVTTIAITFRLER